LHPLPKETRTVSSIARDLVDAQRLLLAIQDSQLAHSALQLRYADRASPQIDVLFEATGAGLAAQIEQLRSIVAPATLTDPGAAVWRSRQELFGDAHSSKPLSPVAKISVLPARIAETLKSLTSIFVTRKLLRYRAVVQATGLGCVRFEGSPVSVASGLVDLREDVERRGGSLMIANHRTPFMLCEAWGTPGDALPLMGAVKRQFDPKSTLNPGRFVGGI
jgi:glycolate oxidase FAD binding subunit